MFQVLITSIEGTETNQDSRWYRGIEVDDMSKIRQLYQTEERIEKQPAAVDSIISNFKEKFSLPNSKRMPPVRQKSRRTLELEKGNSNSPELTRKDKGDNIISHVKRGDKGDDNLSNVKQGDKGGDNFSNVKQGDKGDNNVSRGDKGDDNFLNVKREDKGNNNFPNVKQGDNQDDNFSNIKQEDKGDNDFLNVKQGDNNISNVQLGDKGNNNFPNAKQGDNQDDNFSTMKQRGNNFPNVKQGDKGNDNFQNVKHGDKGDNGVSRGDKGDDNFLNVKREDKGNNNVPNVKQGDNQDDNFSNVKLRDNNFPNVKHGDKGDNISNVKLGDKANNNFPNVKHRDKGDSNFSNVKRGDKGGDNISNMRGGDKEDDKFLNVKQQGDIVDNIIFKDEETLTIIVPGFKSDVKGNGGRKTNDNEVLRATVKSIHENVHLCNEIVWNKNGTAGTRFCTDVDKINDEENHMYTAEGTRSCKDVNRIALEGRENQRRAIGTEGTRSYNDVNRMEGIENQRNTITTEGTISRKDVNIIEDRENQRKTITIEGALSCKDVNKIAMEGRENQRKTITTEGTLSCKDVNRIEGSENQRKTLTTEGTLSCKDLNIIAMEGRENQRKTITTEGTLSCKDVNRVLMECCVSKRCDDDDNDVILRQQNFSDHDDVCVARSTLIPESGIHKEVEGKDPIEIKKGLPLSHNETPTIPIDPYRAGNCMHCNVIEEGNENDNGDDERKDPAYDVTTNVDNVNCHRYIIISPLQNESLKGSGVKVHAGRQCDDDVINKTPTRDSKNESLKGSGVKVQAGRQSDDDVTNKTLTRDSKNESLKGSGVKVQAGQECDDDVINNSPARDSKNESLKGSGVKVQAGRQCDDDVISNISTRDSKNIVIIIEEEGNEKCPDNLNPDVYRKEGLDMTLYESGEGCGINAMKTDHGGGRSNANVGGVSGQNTAGPQIVVETVIVRPVVPEIRRQGPSYYDVNGDENDNDGEDDNDNEDDDNNNGDCDKKNTKNNHFGESYLAVDSYENKTLPVHEASKNNYNRKNENEKLSSTVLLNVPVILPSPPTISSKPTLLSSPQPHPSTKTTTVEKTGSRTNNQSKTVTKVPVTSKQSNAFLSVPQSDGGNLAKANANFLNANGSIAKPPMLRHVSQPNMNAHNPPKIINLPPNTINEHCNNSAAAREPKFQTEDLNSDLAKLKSTALRLNLVTRRPSYLKWLEDREKNWPPPGTMPLGVSTLPKINPETQTTKIMTTDTSDTVYCDEEMPKRDIRKNLDSSKTGTSDKELCGKTARETLGSCDGAVGVNDNESSNYDKASVALSKRRRIGIKFLNRFSNSENKNGRKSSDHIEGERDDSCGDGGNSSSCNGVASKRDTVVSYPCVSYGSSDRLTPDRKQRIEKSLEWLQTELKSMRNQDQSLARQLLTIRQDMHKLRLSLSYQEHRDHLEDVQCDLEDLQEFANVLDLPSTLYLDTPLKNVGVTKWNITARRFSTC